MAPADDDQGPTSRVAVVWRGLLERDPVLYGRLRTGWLLWTWVSLPVLALGLALVPGLAAASGPWLWRYLSLLLVFLVCRTKTLTWRFTVFAFAGGVLLAPVAAVAESVVAGIVDVDLHAMDGAVLVAAPVEEAVKLAPLIALIVFARQRLASFAATDYLLLGAATGLGFQAVEEFLNHLPAAGSPFLPGWPGSPEGAVFAGHHVGTALILGGIGLALRGMRRFGPVTWLLPLLLTAMVVVDHALYNEAAAAPSPPSGAVAIPGWLHTTWDLWGSGGQEKVLLGMVLVLAVVADVRRTRRVWLLLPTIPELGFVTGIRRWSNRAATSLHASVPPTAPRALRAAAGGTAGFLRWLGYTAADLLGELALLMVSTSERGADADPAGPRRRGRRWLRTIVGLRMRRQFAQTVGRQVERGEVPPSRLPSFALAALASVVLVVAVAAVALLATGAGIAAPPVSAPASVAVAFGRLGSWWDSLWFATQALTVVTAAALFTLVTVGLLPDVNIGRGPLASAEELVNHPRRIVGGYLTTRTPGETAGYLVEYLVARLVPARLGGSAARAARRGIDDLVGEEAVYARAALAVARGLHAGEGGTAPRREMPHHVRDRLQSGKLVKRRRQPCYPPQPVILAEDRRFDSYLPYQAIVCRKFSQLGQVEPETAIGHLSDAVHRFVPGDALVDTPYNRSNFRTLVGTKLRGEVRLEAPVQEAPIPQQVLDAADQLGVVIVDEAGKVYNP